MEEAETRLRRAVKELNAALKDVASTGVFLADLYDKDNGNTWAILGCPVRATKFTLVLHPWGRKPDAMPEPTP